MKNKFFISQFYRKRFETEPIYSIYAKLEREPISLADCYEWASPFQSGGYDEDGRWVDEDILYDRYYGFWCHYNADKDEITLSEYRENVGESITKEIFEEFKNQYIDEIRKRAKEDLK